LPAPGKRLIYREKQGSINFELHEGLAQTLSAIKLHVENLQTADAAGSRSTPSVETILPVLREAIEEVRAIAGKLRPWSGPAARRRS
jgi:signal transduction histidine kinase